MCAEVKIGTKLSRTANKRINKQRGTKNIAEGWDGGERKRLGDSSETQAKGGGADSMSQNNERRMKDKAMFERCISLGLLKKGR
jgi:hypothetical protein